MYLEVDGMTMVYYDPSALNPFNTPLHLKITSNAYCWVKVMID